MWARTSLEGRGILRGTSNRHPFDNVRVQSSRPPDATISTQQGRHSRSSDASRRYHYCYNFSLFSATRYDTRCYFNVRSKADMSQLNLPHGTKKCTNRKTKKVKTDMLRSSVKIWGIHVVTPEEEKERLQWEGCAKKEGFKPGMKE